MFISKQNFIINDGDNLWYWIYSFDQQSININTNRKLYFAEFTLIRTLNINALIQYLHRYLCVYGITFFVNVCYCIPSDTRHNSPIMQKQEINKMDTCMVLYPIIHLLKIMLLCVLDFFIVFANYKEKRNIYLTKILFIFANIINFNSWTMHLIYTLFAIMLIYSSFFNFIINCNVS